MKTRTVNTTCVSRLESPGSLTHGSFIGSDRTFPTSGARPALRSRPLGGERRPTTSMGVRAIAASMAGAWWQCSTRLAVTLDGPQYPEHLHLVSAMGTGAAVNFVVLSGQAMCATVYAGTARDMEHLAFPVFLRYGAGMLRGQERLTMANHWVSIEAADRGPACSERWTA